MNAQARKARWLALTAGLIFMGEGILSADVSSPNSKTGKTKPVEARIADTYGKLPLTFEANQGQTDAKVKFLARGDGYGLFLTPTEAVLSFGKPDAASRALHLRWVGANPAPRVSGREEQTGKVNYLKGKDPSGWRRNVPIYARVAYESVYPGIDLVFYGNQRQLEHDYVLAPGADPRKVRFTFEGADRVEIDHSGELVIHLGEEEVRLHRPIAYQDTRAGRGPIPVDYRLIATGGPGLPEVGFTVGIYDPGTALVIDPVLSYSTYLGGARHDDASDIAVDAAGNAYVVGMTYSLDFPRLHSMNPTSEQEEVFITKLSPAGALVYSTILGGWGNETGTAIAVDEAGCAYVTGYTLSPDFPWVHPLPASFRGQALDVFIAKLNPAGSALVFSTYLGGSDNDLASSIAIDPSGAAYVAGRTTSPDFPVLNAVQSSFGGSLDAFVAKLSPSGSALAYSTYLGGSGIELALAVSVDPSGHAVAAGWTGSPDFPTVNAVQGTLAGDVDAFVTRFDPLGTSLVYSTYLGGRNTDSLAGLATDNAGNVYGVGYTSGSFPTINAYQPNRKSGDDVVVVKLSPTAELLYSTYLGGDNTDFGNGIAVDRSGSAVVTGSTLSADFPMEDPIKPECSWSQSCYWDAFVAKLSPEGSELEFSTYLGGADDPYASGEGAADVAVDASGNIYVTGSTRSTSFPTVNAFQPDFGGAESDAFVVKIAFDTPPDCSAAFAAPASLRPANGKSVPISIEGVTDPDGDPITLAVTAIRQDEPLTRAGVPDATGLSTSSPQVRADRAGKGDGRVYHLDFEARDDKGGTCTGTVTVCVPHDQRPGTTCGDGGALFDSTAQ
jgi:hypothetical protein